MSAGKIVDLKYTGFVNFLSDIGFFSQEQKRASLELAPPSDEDGILMTVASQLARLSNEELLLLVGRVYDTYLTLAKVRKERPASAAPCKIVSAKPPREQYHESPEKNAPERVFKKLRREQISKINDQQNSKLITVHDKLYTDSFQKQEANLLLSENTKQEQPCAFSPLSSTKLMSPTTPNQHQHDRFSNSKTVTHWAPEVLHRPKGQANSVLEKFYSKDTLHIKPEIESFINRSCEQSSAHNMNKSGLDNSVESTRGRAAKETTFERLYGDAEKKRNLSQSLSRLSRESRELMACTFSPQINNAHSSKHASSRNSAKKLSDRFPGRNQEPHHKPHSAFHQDEAHTECPLQPEVLMSFPHPLESLARGVSSGGLRGKNPLIEVAEQRKIGQSQQTHLLDATPTYNRLYDEMSKKDFLLHRDRDPPRPEIKASSRRGSVNRRGDLKSSAITIGDSASSASSNQSSFRTADSSKNSSLRQKENVTPSGARSRISQSKK